MSPWQQRTSIVLALALAACGPKPSPDLGGGGEGGDAIGAGGGGGDPEQALKAATPVRPVVKGEDTVTRDVYARDYDLVVLATGMEPSTAGFDLPVTLSQDDYGFIVPHVEDTDGMFSAGVAQGPLDVSMSVQSATAAALKAIQAVDGA